ncbi:MAG: hypothetical protein QOE70_3892 [Chthoniobacter sp.]|jgi:hypothetical protein|nr:hypothetical protein [Chthoniobacter sp.]
MNLRTPFLISAGLTLTALILHAEDKPKKWEEMDYGRFLSATFLNPQGKTTIDGQGSAANKGIAVKLGNAEAAALFDTETVRMAGGWTGGWVKLKGVAFDGGHGPNPSPVDNASVYFQNNPGPGWSKGDDFNDPRKLPTGPGAAKVPFGPIPKEWAKYRGLYLSGDDVVFAYTVGEAMVLEHPALEKAGDVTLLTRTFNVVKGGAGASVKVADHPNGGELALADGQATIAKDDPKNPDTVTVAGVVGAPAGAQLSDQGGFLSFKLPQLAAGTSFKIVYAHGAAADGAKLGAAVKGAGKPADLKPLTKGGPAHWLQTVTTQGELAKNENAPYVLDTVGVPLDNPYHSWLRIGGLDFFPDGRAAVSTWSGDVWIVSGLDKDLQNVTWKRYASGLFHALGLKIVDKQIYVLGRDQITRLHDLNNDGEADLYENFNNDVQITPNFHEFAFDVQTDPEGNFYFTKGGPVNPGGRGWGPLSDHNGCLFKISKDGQKFEVFATGIRAPNGMGVGPNGEITIGDNQGTWVPACYIHLVKPGEFVTVADLAHREPVPTEHTPHICYLPMSMDNSSGGQTWVTSDKWGPLSGRLLHFTYGKSGLLGVLIEDVGGVKQGGAFRFPFKFDTGAMRGRFNPIDGQLYVVGLKGWQTDGAKDGAFQRVRYTGKPACLPEGLHVTDKGIRISFTGALDTGTASDAGNYSMQQWNYHWTKEYGSPDFKLSNPEEKGRDTVEIKSVTVADDRKSVLLEVPDLKPVDQYQIKLNIKAEDGSDLPKEIVGTINVVAPDAKPGVTYSAKR